MQVTETSAEGLKREFKITIPANEVEDKITKRLDEVGRMVANFMAQPAGGVRLNVTDEYDNGLRIGSSKDGPFLQFIRAGKVAQTLPDSGGRR